MWVWKRALTLFHTQKHTAPCPASAERCSQCFLYFTWIVQHFGKDICLPCCSCSTRGRCRAQKSCHHREVASQPAETPGSHCARSRSGLAHFFFFFSPSIDWNDKWKHAYLWASEVSVSFGENQASCSLLVALSGINTLVWLLSWKCLFKLELFLFNSVVVPLWWWLIIFFSMNIRIQIIHNTRLWLLFGYTYPGGQIQIWGQKKKWHHHTALCYSH